MKPTRAGIQEIKYREQWTHDRFLQNELYDRQITEEDINNIPFPYLRSAILKKRQEKQGPIPFTIGFLLNLLFGGYQAAAAAAAATSTSGESRNSLSNSFLHLRPSQLPALQLEWPWPSQLLPTQTR